MTKEVKVGDIQPGPNDSEWVVISVQGTRISRVLRNSIAHHVHSVGQPEIAKSLGK
jgi:hypothetical protein